MSVKIYNAFKLKHKSDMWPLVRDIRRKATENVRCVLRDIYAELMCSAHMDPDFKSLLERYGTETTASRAFARSQIRQRYKESAFRAYRSDYDFNVCVCFREWKGSIYLIPYCDSRMRGVLSFLSRDKRLVDYHYQTSSDKPKRVSRQAWEGRKSVWNGMHDTGQWYDMLTLDICSYDNFYLIDPGPKCEQT